MKRALAFSILLLVLPVFLFAQAQEEPANTSIHTNPQNSNHQSNAVQAASTSTTMNQLDYGRSKVAHSGIGVRDFLSTFVALLFVLFLIAAIAWMLRRSGLAVNNNQSIIRILATTHLSSKEKLVLVEVSGEQILLGVSPGQIEHIITLKEPVVMKNETKQEFSPLLSRLLKK